MPSSPPRVLRIDAVAVIGLGYVGLPLAAAFGQKVRTVGFDINDRRVRELQAGHDATGTLGREELSAPMLAVTSDPRELASVDAYVVAVPTPVDGAKRPDLTPLLRASDTVGSALAARAKAHPDRPPAIVVYESTVYPGCTEEACVPALLQASALPRDSFRVGYSPERINPGDTEHTLERIVKIVSGEDDATRDALAELYGKVVKAGIHKAPNIKTAEAAKVIENTQRDLNIALMNELSVIFHRLGIDTLDVLRAAGTKWNFLPFRPGLVGGHCIPVDPYYLTHKAEEIGYHPEVILAGRRINESVGDFIAGEAVKEMIRRGIDVRAASVLVRGLTYKEDVPDLRSSKAVDLVRALESYGLAVHVEDPLVPAGSIAKLGFAPPPEVASGHACVVLAVPHRELRSALDVATAGLRKGGLFVDVKGVFEPEAVARAGFAHWRL